MGENESGVNETGLTPEEIAKQRILDKLEAQMIADKFSPVSIANFLLEKFNFITARDNEEIYYYNDGVYHSKGETFIKEKAKVICDNISRNAIGEVIHHIQASTYIDRNKINGNATAIHLKNGIYDWDMNIFMEFTPKQISTIRIPVTYDKNEDCPAIKKFLKEILYDTDIPVIQELFGYVLLKDYPIQKAFMFVGEGSNGKSVLIHIIKMFLGVENTSSVAIQDFDTKSFYLAQLYGKLANLYPDIPDKALYSTGRFKMLTGGDNIFADKKFKDGINFVNYAKLVFSANKLPETRDDTAAFYRRWIFINFPNTFTDETKDPNLSEKLTTEKELSGLLNWAVAGLKRLIQNGKFSYSKSTEELQDTYERLSNSLLAFTKDMIEIDTTHEIPKDTFFNVYVDYCKNANLPIKSKNSVGRELAVHLPVTESVPSINGKRVKCWKGIKIKPLKNEGELDKIPPEENGKDKKVGLDKYSEDAKDIEIEDSEDEVFEKDE